MFKVDGMLFGVYSVCFVIRVHNPDRLYTCFCVEMAFLDSLLLLVLRHCRKVLVCVAHLHLHLHSFLVLVF